MSVENLLPKAESLGRILVVDDEEALTKVLCARLQEHGYAAIGVTTGAEALATLREQELEVLLCDLMMPGMDGTALLKASLEIDPHLVGVVMTGLGTVQSAVEAMKQGACDYLLKPFKIAELLPVLAKALELRRLRLENIGLLQTIALYELTATLRFTQDLNTILDKTAEVALQHLGADEASIMLPTQEGTELLVAAVRGGQREHLLGRRVPCEDGVAGWVARHREALVLDGPVQGEQFGETFPRANLGASLSLPMLVAGELVGVLNLNDTSRRRSFTAGEIKALHLLTSIAAEALKANRSSEQTRAAEAQYRAIFDNAVVGIFQTTPEGRFRKANQAMARMLGYESPEELIAAISDIGSQVYASGEWREELNRRLENEGRVHGLEFEVRRRDGSALWVLMSVRGLRDAEGAICHHEGMVEDITARRQAELALRASEERYRRLAENAKDIIYRLRVYPNPGFEYVNPAATTITGYTPEEYYADSDLGQKIVHPDDQLLLLAAMAQEGPAVESLVLRWIHKSGRVIWIEQRNALLHDETGRLVAVEGIARDITTRKQQELEEKALQQVRTEVWKMQKSEDITQVLEEVKNSLQAMGVPFQACGINIIINNGNDAKVYSYEMNADGGWRSAGEEEIPHLVQFWRGDVPVYRRDLEQEDPYGERDLIAHTFGSFRRSVLDVPFSHGTLAINSDRPDAFFEEDIAFLEKLAGVVSEGLHRQDDLKKLHETQQQLYQSQKLEALGRLAGGVAHDFNNLITVIDGYSRMALKQLPQGDSLLRSAVEEVQRAGERAEALVRQLLAFSRRQPSVYQTLEFNQVVSGVEKMLRRLIGEDVELSIRLAPDVGSGEADPGQLEQVLVNLVVNARDAMPQGGQLTIETALCQLDELAASSLGLEAGGRYCRLSVHDTGVGMSAEVQQHIFEPFFTTKEAGKGTGLGLATVYGIVKEHRGGIQVRSQQGKGTTFAIYLPGGAAGEEEQDPAREAGLSRGGETILLVEDDGNLRRLVCRILRELGYTVLAVDQGDMALQVCIGHPEPIALLLTDVVLPGLNGYALAAQAAALRPGIKTLYMSGYADGGERAQGLGVHFLAKPFTLGTLSQAVRQALGSD